jgi:hypothetical protein
MRCLFLSRCKGAPWTGTALALAGSLSKENLVLLYRCIRPQLSHDDATLQKKSYKVALFLLGGVDEANPYSGTAQPGAGFASDRAVLMDMCEAFAEATSSCLAAARPLRHRCVELAIVSASDPVRFCIFCNQQKATTQH